MSVERECGTRRVRVKSVACAISLLSLLPVAAEAQSYPVYNGNPIVGGSTLDLIKPPKADKTDFQFPSGFNCRVDGGDVPSVVVYADQGGVGQTNYTLSGGRAGVAFVLPLYQPRRNMCDRAVKTQNMQDALELAEKLVDSGAMSNEEYLELARKYKRELLQSRP
jgi:hypothetical protein